LGHTVISCQQGFFEITWVVFGLKQSYIFLERIKVAVFNRHATECCLVKTPSWPLMARKPQLHPYIYPDNKDGCEMEIRYS
jgi:hypothetical protein